MFTKLIITGLTSGPQVSAAALAAKKSGLSVLVLHEPKPFCFSFESRVTPSALYEHKEHIDDCGDFGIDSALILPMVSSNAECAIMLKQCLEVQMRPSVLIMPVQSLENFSWKELQAAKAEMDADVILKFSREVIETTNSNPDHLLQFVKKGEHAIMKPGFVLGITLDLTTMTTKGMGISKLLNQFSESCEANKRTLLLSAPTITDELKSILFEQKTQVTRMLKVSIHSFMEMEKGRRQVIDTSKTTFERLLDDIIPLFKEVGGTKEVVEQNAETVEV